MMNKQNELEKPINEHSRHFFYFVEVFGTLGIVKNEGQIHGISTRKWVLL